MGTMFSTYLSVVVAIAEIIGGILLAIPKTKIVGWFEGFLVIFNIVVLHVAHDFVGNVIWLLPTILFLTANYFQKGKIYSLIN
ncbi:hypothetical protein FGM00_15385 [Aggregatimonas sangjinii]|uniref:DoxX family protein n=1 Tax=Aggregatimonas sangjinii TaxID=2583587 RepID=A0A5B7SWU5_9FLAO|nr:hypothetical protein [Aggregatimonas sangjinii]QCX01421.1 hypothetical protein FGM00_15385 [Aggregatimonas sangjinii]